MEEAFKKFIKEQSYYYGSRVMDPEESDHVLAKAAFEAGFNAAITEDDEKEGK